MSAQGATGPGRAAGTRRALLRRALALGSAALTLSVQPAAARQEPPTAPAAAAPGPTRGGTLRIGKAEDILVAGAPHVFTPGNLPLYHLVYDTLVSYDAQLSPQPRLATSWAWSDDFRELTLRLRPGVQFHTGRPFTSDDVKFNLERLRDPADGSQWRNYARLMQVAAPTPDTLVISFEAPARGSFDALAFTHMADPQTLDQTAAGPRFVGTGPFRVHEYVPGDHLTVVANPAYWESGKPYLDQVELRVLPDLQAAVVTLEAGGVDWLSGVQGPDARRLQADAAYQVLLTGSGGTFYYLGLDVTTPPLADKRVRQAFSFAVNRQRLVDIALSGFGRPASIPWPQQSLAFDAVLDQTYTYDPARARQLLDAAGWDASTVIPFSVPSGVAVSAQMAEIVQSDLANVGVRTALQTLNPADFVQHMQKAQFAGAWITSMSFMNLSPATLFETAFAVRVPNGSNFSSQRYQDLINQTITAADDQQLKQGLRELTQILLDEAFVVPIAEGTAQQTGPVVARAGVRNLTWDQFGGFAYQDIWLA